MDHKLALFIKHVDNYSREHICRRKRSVFTTIVALLVVVVVFVVCLFVYLSSFVFEYGNKKIKRNKKIMVHTFTKPLKSNAPQKGHLYFR